MIIKKLLLNIKILNIKILKKSFSINLFGDYFFMMLFESFIVNFSILEIEYVCLFIV